MTTIFHLERRRHSPPGNGGLEPSKETKMRNDEAIQQYLEQARIARSIYLGNMIAAAIAKTRVGLPRAAKTLWGAIRAKTRRNVFTFSH